MSKTLAELKVMFETGKIPDGQDYADFIDATYNAISDALIVQSVNNVTPVNGNVNTDYKIISPIRADIEWTYYPEGTSEFYIDYDPADYEGYIEDNPSFGQLEAGDIAVRTLIIEERDIVVQQVDNVKDGIFKAAYTRLGNPDGTWGELVKHSNSSTTNYEFVEKQFFGFIDEGDTVATIEIPLNDATNSSFKFHDDGMLISSDTYTYTYDSGTLTLTLDEPAGWPVRVIALVSKVETV